MEAIQFSFWETVLRISIAAVCGGIIGLERGRKHRPAGFRTHMIVCMGAALSMALSAYLVATITNVWGLEGVSTDVSRFGAQVINGIGFLGAGSIIVTGRQQVKGMTTASGLWASACMGLAIGAGFYIAALMCCLLIIIATMFLSRLEGYILSRSRNINIYVEVDGMDAFTEIIAALKTKGVKIFDVELTKAKYSETKYPYAIFTLQLPKRTAHTDIFTLISEVSEVRAIEEL